MQGISLSLCPLECKNKYIPTPTPTACLEGLSYRLSKARKPHLHITYLKEMPFNIYFLFFLLQFKQKGHSSLEIRKILKQQQIYTENFTLILPVHSKRPAKTNFTKMSSLKRKGTPYSIMLPAASFSQFCGLIKRRKEKKKSQQTTDNKCSWFLQLYRRAMKQYFCVLITKCICTLLPN